MKKISSVFFVPAFLCLAVLFAAAAFAAQPALDRPSGPEIRAGKNTMDETTLIVSLPVPQSIRDFAAEAETQSGAPNLLIEFDTRTDGGRWFMDRDSEQRRENSLQGTLLEGRKYRFMVYDPGADLKNMTEYVSEFEAFMFELDEWDLKNHSYSFRYRYVYEQLLPGPGGPSYEERSSPWSDEAAIGKSVRSKNSTGE
jgi:hypothetical protein